jgi:hypothetical protein
VCGLGALRPESVSEVKPGCSVARNSRSNIDSPALPHGFRRKLRGAAGAIKQSLFPTRRPPRTGGFKR